MSQPGGQGRSGLFWIALVAAGSCALCTAFSFAILGVGYFSADSSVGAPPTSVPGKGGGEGGDWIPAGEISRSQTLTQPLVGGRWLYQSGSSFDTVLSRSGNTAMVQGNRSGSLWEFIFEEGGDYRLAWRNSTSLGGRASTSWADERGSWALEGTTLTLKPESQHAHYENANGEQEEEDKDLGERQYQVVDIQLESVESAGVALKRWPGVELSGPCPKWGFDERISVDLQRL